MSSVQANRYLWKQEGCHNPCAIQTEEIIQENSQPSCPWTWEEIQWQGMSTSLPLKVYFNYWFDWKYDSCRETCIFIYQAYLSYWYLASSYLLKTRYQVFSHVNKCRQLIVNAWNHILECCVLGAKSHFSISYLLIYWCLLLQSPISCYFILIDVGASIYILLVLKAFSFLLKIRYYVFAQHISKYRWLIVNGLDHILECCVLGGEYVDYSLFLY